MALHRRAARRDANEPDIVKALRDLGCHVLRMSGPGLPDLAVGYAHTTVFLGVKRPDGPRGGTSKGRDRQSGDQRPDDWPGGPWEIVTTEAEAVEAVLRAVKLHAPSPLGMTHALYTRKREGER